MISIGFFPFSFRFILFLRSAIFVKENSSDSICIYVSAWEYDKL